MRKVHIKRNGQEEEWKYTIGRSHVLIYFPSSEPTISPGVVGPGMKRIYVHTHKIMEMKVYAYEHDVDKRNLHVKPSNVKRYIENHLLNKKDQYVSSRTNRTSTEIQST